MGFLKAAVTDDNFIRGSARVLWAASSQAFPTKISDVIVLTAGGTQYDPQSGWNDLGATKTGIQISRNNAEETYEVDQIVGEIASAPTEWTMQVQTALAEVSPDNIILAWQGGTKTTDTDTDAPGTPAQSHSPLGLPDTYVRRRLVVLHKRSNDKIRMWAFRKVQKAPQESSLSHQKQGEQQSVPVLFRCLADTSVNDPLARFGEIIDQV